jgi:hypothetical protein
MALPLGKGGGGQNISDRRKPVDHCLHMLWIWLRRIEPKISSRFQKSNMRQQVQPKEEPSPPQRTINNHQPLKE